MLLLCLLLFLSRRGELLRGRDKLLHQRHPLLQRRHLSRLCLDEGLVLVTAGLGGFAAASGVVAALLLGCKLLEGGQLGCIKAIWHDL
jgi:hypothetical protein